MSHKKNKPIKANRDHISEIEPDWCKETTYKKYPYKKGFGKPLFPKFPFKCKRAASKIDEEMRFTDDWTAEEILKETGGLTIPPSEQELEIIDQTVKSRDMIDILDFLEGVCNAQNCVEMSRDKIIKRLRAYQRRSIETKTAPKTSDKVETSKEPLSENQAAVYELLKELPKHKAMIGKEILKKLEDKIIIIDQSTLTKNIIPALRPYGIKNKRGVGYYIDK